MCCTTLRIGIIGYFNLLYNCDYPLEFLIKLVFQIPLKTYKYCANTCEYYTCRWTHFSSIGSILVSIMTILAEYCPNTCKHWASEYTLWCSLQSTNSKGCITVIVLFAIILRLKISSHSPLNYCFWVFWKFTNKK